MFAPLHFDLAGARVLDVFGGTGALGIEAFSRGASCVVIIEKSHTAMQIIRENCASIGSPQEILLMEMSWQAAFAKLAGQPPFDFVFIDPPYDSGQYGPVLSGLAAGHLAGRDSLMILESDRPLELHLPGWQTVREKRYGSVFVTWEKLT